MKCILALLRRGLLMRRSRSVKIFLLGKNGAAIESLELGVY